MQHHSPSGEGGGSGEHLAAMSFNLPAMEVTAVELMRSQRGNAAVMRRRVRSLVLGSCERSSIRQQRVECAEDAAAGRERAAFAAEQGQAEACCSDLMLHFDAHPFMFLFCLSRSLRSSRCFSFLTRLCSSLSSPLRSAAPAFVRRFLSSR